MKKVDRDIVGRYKWRMKEGLHSKSTVILEAMFKLVPCAQCRYVNVDLISF
jgi:hypothetical protein